MSGRIAQLPVEIVVTDLPRQGRLAQLPVEVVLTDLLRDARIAQLSVELVVPRTVYEAYPTGSFVIDSDAASSSDIVVELEITYSANATHMRFRNADRDFGDWIPVQATYAWALAAGSSGTKTVYMQLKDENDAESPEYSDTIELEVPTQVLTQIGTIID